MALKMRKRKLIRRASAPAFVLWLVATLLAGGVMLHQKESAASASAVKQSPATRAAKRVLVISLDGLDARYLLKRDEYGLKIPTLRRLMAEGTWARGVVSVYPSLTYPAHTTLVTGATPRRHGIFGNNILEMPPAPQTGAAHWFARDIRAETLWDAARRAKLSTGMVSWPVAGGTGDWNVPEIWKPGGTQNDSLGEIAMHARPSGLVEEIAKRDPALYAKATADETDDMRTRFAEYVIGEKKPDVMLVHLFDLDHFEHDEGPFTPQAFEMLEKTDGYVARLLDAARRAGTLAETAVFIVSDHGFKSISQQIQPGVILERAGLLKTREEKDAQGRTRTLVADDWRALPYPTAGSCAIILRNPRDGDAMRRALAAFREYAGAENQGRRAKGDGLLRIIYAEHLAKLGSNPRAAFMLEAADGYAFGGSLTGEPLAATRQRGTHGYLPSGADYRTSFIAAGASVTRRGDLGVVHMLDIGPTIAATLGLKLRDADGRPLKLR